MSIVKKTIVLLLVMLLLLSSVTGCNKKKDPESSSSKTSSSTGSESAESTGTDTDTSISGESSAIITDGDGSVITGKSETGLTNSKTTPTVGKAYSSDAVKWLRGKTVQIHLGVYDSGKEATTTAGKYAIQQRTAIEKKYGCKLVVKTINYNTFLPKLMSGDSQGADIVDSSGPNILKVALANNLFKELDGLVDINQSYINKDHTIKAASNGKCYTIIPKRYGLDYIGENLVMWFNKRLVKNAGYNADDIYKWWKNGTWTWSKLDEIAAKINDPAKSIQGIGNGYQDNLMWVSLLLSNGADLITTVNGKPNFNIDSAKSLEALKFWQKLSKYMDLSVMDTQDALFIQGRTGFLPQYINRLQFSNFSKMKDDFGIIPLPKGPSASKYISPISFLWGLAIPTATLKNDDKNNTKAKALSIIIEELCKPSIPNNVLNQTKDVVFESVVRDKGSYDVLQAVDGKISEFSNYYFAMHQAGLFHYELVKVAKGELDINTAIKQNKDKLTEDYRKSLLGG